MEKILQKIEAIRREPEHIRIRYVFLSVVVSMVFVGILWMFSIYEGLRSVSNSKSVAPPSLNLPKAPSLDDFSKNVKGGSGVTGEEFFQNERLREGVPDSTGTEAAE